MDVTTSLISDPLYAVLPPSIEDLLTYSEELDYEGHNITWEWAINEIKNHMSGWVRVGLVAAKVRLYRLYKGVYATFQEFCQKRLKLPFWKINNLIKAAQVVMDLAQAGYEVLPTCEAQARPLVRFIEDGLYEVWDKVLRSFPPHQITAAAIESITDPDKPKKLTLRVNKNLGEKLQRKALDLGISVETLIEQMLDEEDGEPESEPDDEDAKNAIALEMEIWQEDLKALIAEYERGDYDDFLSSA
jgi:hypothetical protein